jgi:hypothetical protein
MGRDPERLERSYETQTEFGEDFARMTSNGWRLAMSTTEADHVAAAWVRNGNTNGPSGVVLTTDDLAKLEELRDKGILTEDEFTAKKTQFLERNTAPAPPVSPDVMRSAPASIKVNPSGTDGVRTSTGHADPLRITEAETIMEAGGSNGKIKLLADRVVIKRQSLARFIMRDKEILLSNIAEIEFKDITLTNGYRFMWNGYIRFILNGERKTGTNWSIITKDENSVTFSFGQGTKFRMIKQIIEDMSASSSGQLPFPSIEHQMQVFVRAARLKNPKVSDPELFGQWEGLQIGTMNVAEQWLFHRVLEEETRSVTEAASLPASAKAAPADGKAGAAGESTTGLHLSPLEDRARTFVRSELDAHPKASFPAISNEWRRRKGLNLTVEEARLLKAAFDLERKERSALPVRSPVQPGVQSSSNQELPAPHMSISTPEPLPTQAPSGSDVRATPLNEIRHSGSSADLFANEQIEQLIKTVLQRHPHASYEVVLSEWLRAMARPLSATEARLLRPAYERERRKDIVCPRCGRPNARHRQSCRRCHWKLSEPFTISADAPDLRGGSMPGENQPADVQTAIEPEPHPPVTAILAAARSTPTEIVPNTARTTFVNNRTPEPDNGIPSTLTASDRMKVVVEGVLTQNPKARLTDVVRAWEQETPPPLTQTEIVQLEDHLRSYIVSHRDVLESSGRAESSWAIAWLPGFRSGTWWKALLAVGGYALLISWMVFVPARFIPAMILIIALVAVNVLGIRHHIPFLDSRHWYVLGVAAVAYIVVLSFTLICLDLAIFSGLRSQFSLAFGGALLLGLLFLAGNGGGLRSRIPMINSASRSTVVFGWIGILVLATIAWVWSLMATPLAAPDLRTDIASGPTDPQGPSIAVPMDSSPSRAESAVAAVLAVATATMRPTATMTAKPTDTPRPTATPTPVSRVWRGPDRDVEIGFGASNAIKVKVLEVTRSNNLRGLIDGLPVDVNSELLIVRLEYRSTQGRNGHPVTAAKDFALRTSGSEITPLADEQVTVPELLNGHVPDGQALTGNIVFLVSAPDVVSSLVYTGTRERKQIDISGGGGAIRQAQPTFTPSPTATTDFAKVAALATTAVQHLDAAQEYRSAGQLGLALVELDQALGIVPDLEPALQLQSQVQAQATVGVRHAQAEVHVSNARDQQASGQLGLALVELNQALGIAPDYEPAQELVNQVRAQATAVVQQAQAQATAQAVATALARDAVYDRWLATITSQLTQRLGGQERILSSIYPQGARRIIWIQTSGVSRLRAAEMCRAVANSYRSTFEEFAIIHIYGPTGIDNELAQCQ